MLISLHTIAIAVFYAGFGQGTGPVFWRNVGCTGTESSLLSCSHDGTYLYYCSHSRDAGVVCPSCESCIYVQIVLTSELPSLVLATGLFTACGILCKLWLMTSPQLCIISNAHVILHAYQVATVQPVSCGVLPNLSRHPPLNNPLHSCNVILLLNSL